MCNSYCSQLLYGLLMFACLVFTAVALFSSSWSEAKNIFDSNNNGYNTGIMPWTCFENGQSCKDWWNTSPAWVRTTAVLMCIALALDILALIWSIISLFSCCARRYCLHPLCPFALLAFIALLASVIVYSVNNKDIFKADNIAMSNLGWSFWLAVSATVCSGFATIVGGAAVSCAAKEY